MKGVILAGGLGTRLLPCTRVTNKHLLPVYNQPMIYYPLRTMLNAGITEIMLVTGGNHAGDFLMLLGNGKEMGIRDLHYTYQEGHGGIADALRLTEDFADGGPVCVVLGDNIIEGNINRAVQNFKKQKTGARIILTRADDPRRFGVATVKNGKVVKIVEKPKKPESDKVVTGMYLYDSRVYDIVRKLKPSARGELEITDVNNHYLKAGELEYDELKGWWSDAGTFDSLFRVSQLIHKTGANNTSA